MCAKGLANCSCATHDLRCSLRIGKHFRGREWSVSRYSLKRGRALSPVHDSSFETSSEAGRWRLRCS